MKNADLMEVLSGFISAIPVSIMVVDREGIISLVNSTLAELVGYEEGELVGKNVDILVPLNARSHHASLRKEYYTVPHRRIMAESKDLFAAHKSGSSFPVEISLSPLVADDGVMVIAAIHDLTARKKREQEKEKLDRQIQQSQKLESLGVLAGGIAHDFNNLLTSILGHASLARKQVQDDSALSSSLVEIERTSERASELIMQMLAYSGKGHFLIKPINLSKVVDEMASLLQTAISKKAVIRYDFFDGLPDTKGDITQIRQVMMNLITNASDAIGERSGIITLRTGMMNVDNDYLSTMQLHGDLPEGDYVYLEVADTGIGMSSETMDMIFDPFYTTKSTGRGLGLAAVQGIVRGHKGAIKIYSELNKGTTFKVILPVSDVPNVSQAKPVSEVSDWTSDKTVLIVDDEESVRAFMLHVLTRKGLRVLQAVDGREGVKIFSEHADEIDLVLLDLTMPHIGGVEAYRQMRRINDKIQVIMMSGYSEEEVVSQFAGKEISGFLQKPFRLDMLLDTVHNALDD